MKNKNEWKPGAQPTDETIAEVLGMDDDSLRTMVRSIAEASGVSGARADMMTRDADAIRRKLSSVRAEDLQRALAQITPEQMTALTEQLQKLKQQNK